MDRNLQGGLNAGEVLTLLLFEVNTSLFDTTVSFCKNGHENKFLLMDSSFIEMFS